MTYSVYVSVIEKTSRSSLSEKMTRMMPREVQKVGCIFQVPKIPHFAPTFSRVGDAITTGSTNWSPPGNQKRPFSHLDVPGSGWINGDRINGLFHL